MADVWRCGQKHVEQRERSKQKARKDAEPNGNSYYVVGVAYVLGFAVAMFAKLYFGVTVCVQRLPFLEFLRRLSN